MTGFILILIIIGAYIYLKRDKKKSLAILLNAYHEAQQSGDKGKALYAGRLYYSKLRSTYWGLKDGYLTMYDEQAITNDLSTMTQK